MFVCLAIGTTYSTDSNGQKILVKMLRCRARALPSYALVGHFYSASCTCVRITIGAHAQYYTWCNRAILIRPLEFVRCYLCCSSCLRARYCMPTSSGTSKEIFAKARARHKVHRVPLHYCTSLVGQTLTLFPLESLASETTTAPLHREFSTSVLSSSY